MWVLGSSTRSRRLSASARRLRPSSVTTSAFAACSCRRSCSDSRKRHLSFAWVTHPPEDQTKSPHRTLLRAFFISAVQVRGIAMSLKDRITEDMKAAMRAKEADKLTTIRMLLAAVKQKEVDERVVVDDVALVAIVDKLIKQRKDSLSQFTAAGRMDLADKEAAELTVLEAYLPQRLSADEIQAAVNAIVAETGAKGPGDMGKAM